MHTVYEGERVRIRPFRDADEYAYVVTTEINTPNDHWGIWNGSLSGIYDEFKDSGFLSAGKYSAFAVERLDTGEVVGYEEYGEFSANRPATWIGTYIIEEHQHNGFGIEAKLLNMCYLFENYPFRMLFADTTQTHKRAQNGLEKVGMTYCGARRRAHVHYGRYVDIVQYQIMRSEWEALPIRKTVRRGA